MHQNSHKSICNLTIFSEVVPRIPVNRGGRSEGRIKRRRGRVGDEGCRKRRSEGMG
jgi:hypothetical protein